MKLHQILSRLQKLHPKEIDLSLDRIKKLCEKLGNPQDNLKYISVIFWLTLEKNVCRTLREFSRRIFAPKIYAKTLDIYHDNDLY